MTDITKYKSLIVRIETHEKIKKLAGKERKMTGVVGELVDKKYEEKFGKRKSQ
mgnify:CR=1 FL=1|tara:strand:+ start:84 stop:242 length:159 start_codon:yes stop_codon:yes gene_type:complete